jgi:hypothetical protein
MSVESDGGKISTGETDTSIRALWHLYKHNHLVAKEEKLAKGTVDFALRSISFIF